jgi:hypothetical protein
MRLRDPVIYTKFKRALLYGVVLTLVLALIPTNKVYGAELLQKTLEIGTSLASSNTFHDYSFSLPASSNIGSIAFEYCSNSPITTVACIPPAGINVSGFVIDSQSGVTGFSASVATVAHRAVITRPVAVSGPANANYRFSNITNPSSANQTVFVRITLYSSLDGTGTPVDRGSVAFAIVEGIGIGGFVPPSLTFCVGVTVSLDCTTTSGSLIDFGELSATQPVTSTSQYSGYTNDATGFIVYVNGQTMTSGNIIIQQMAATLSSQSGTAQFGINLQSNSSPSVGGNVQGAGSSISTANYSSTNQFRFQTGEAISSTNLPTNPNRFTVSYIVNVPEDQKPGHYSTTLQYTAVASF